MINFRLFYENSEEIVRACANCEREFGIQNSNKNVTHGMCKRHLLQSYRELIKMGASGSREKYKDVLARPDSDFPPDLSAKPITESTKTHVLYDLSKLERVTDRELIKSFHILPGDSIYLSPNDPDHYIIDSYYNHCHVYDPTPTKETTSMSSWIYDRLDGPAWLNKATGEVQYSIKDVRISKSEYWQRPEVIAFKSGGREAVNMLNI